MVIPGEASSPVELMPSPPPSRPASSPIATRGKSQSHLHDFSFPVLKSWGNQRFLRCVNVGKNDELAGAPSSSSRSLSNPGSSARSDEKTGGGGDKELEGVREKLMVHLREAAGRIDLAAREEEEEVRASPSASVDPAPAAPAPAAERPWNLRTRRAAASKGFTPSPSLPRSEFPPAPAAEEIPGKSLRSRPEKGEKAWRRKFSVSLSEEEIEEDVYAVTGRRPHRRPKKRPRTVQRQLDMLFPGLWLTEVTAESYKVLDPPPPDSGKR